MNSLLIFVHETVAVSDEFVVEILFERITTRNYVSFSTKELNELRDVLRVSVGDYADDLTEEYLSDFGTSMLQATAVILKAKCASRGAITT